MEEEKEFRSREAWRGRRTGNGWSVVAWADGLERWWSLEGGGSGAQVPGLCSLPLLASRSFAALSGCLLCSGQAGRLVVQCNGAPARGLRTWSYLRL